MLIDVVQNQNGMVVGYVNKSGQIEVEQVNTKFSNLERCSEQDPNKEPILRNWGDNSPLKRVPGFKFKDLNLREFITKRAPEPLRNKIHAFNKPNVFSFDIEIDMENRHGEPCKEFPSPEEGKYPIDSICIVGHDLNVLTLTTRPDRLKDGDNLIIEKKINEYFDKYEIPKGLIKNLTQNGQINYNHIAFKSEREMLIKFFALQKNMLHCLSAWNIMFDKVYIDTRAKKLGLSRGLASPVEDINRAMNKYTQSPYFRLEIDYMELCKKYGTGYLKKSNKLDYVAGQLLGVGKLEHDKSFLKFYLGSYTKFLTYGAIDTILIQMIAEKYNYFDNVLVMAYYTKAPILKSTSVTAVADNLWFDEAINNGIFNANYGYRPTKTASYEGGFVVDPRRKTSHWVAVLDFKSLYPSSMRQLNCSPEAHAGKIDINNKEQFLAAQKAGYAISLRGNLYKNTEDNYLKSIMNRLIEERYHYKRVKFKAHKILEIIEEELESRGVHMDF